MSFNANTQYKAIDLQQLANECRQAIEGRSYSPVDQWEGEDLYQWSLEASPRGLKADVG